MPDNRCREKIVFTNEQDRIPIQYTYTRKIVQEAYRSAFFYRIMVPLFLACVSVLVISGSFEKINIFSNSG